MPEPIERVQANAFVTPTSARARVSLWRTAVTVGDLTATVSRYLGESGRPRLEPSPPRGGKASSRTAGRYPHAPLRRAPARLGDRRRLLAARPVADAAARPIDQAAFQLLDDASAAIQYSRDLLQTALDNARQGVSVFDKDLRLQAWNRAFRDLWDLPAAMMRVGVGLDEIIRHIAERGSYGPGTSRTLIADAAQAHVAVFEPFQTRLHPSRSCWRSGRTRCPTAAS